MVDCECGSCGRRTLHFNVNRSAEAARVTRTTIYNWMNRGLLHWVAKPSGRRFICANSLLRDRRARPVDRMPAP